MSEPEAEFYRGPHDGLVLKIGDIRRYCHLVRMQGDGEERLFAMMPALPDWERVMCGDLPADGPFDTLFPYELLPRDDGAAFYPQGR